MDTQKLFLEIVKRGCIKVINNNEALEIVLNDFEMTFDEAYKEYKAILIALGHPEEVADLIAKGFAKEIARVSQKGFTVAVNDFLPEWRKGVEGKGEHIIIALDNGGRMEASIFVIEKGVADGIETVFATNKEFYDWVKQYVRK